MATPKTAIIVCNRHRRGSVTETEPMTLEDALKYYGYALECGASYQHEKGNKKINREPKSFKSLITNLNNAVNNSAADGYAGVDYALKT